jgi:hypothetical protein
LRFTGRIAMGTEMEGEPHGVLHAETDIGPVRAWFRDDGRLVRAELPPRLLDGRILGGLPPMAAYEQAALAAARPDPELLAAALRDAGLPEAVAGHLVALERTATRSKRGRRPRDAVEAWAERWVVYLEVLRQMADGKTRHAACRTVAAWHGDKDLNQLIPRLSDYKKFTRFFYCWRG